MFLDTFPMALKLKAFLIKNFGVSLTSKTPPKKEKKKHII